MPLPPFKASHPVQKVTYTSRFGPRQLTGIRGSFHPGLDYAAAVGTPIHAAAPGIVLGAGLGPAGLNPDGSYGVRVVLDHGQGWKTTYNHFSGLAVDLVKGRSVKAGDLLGFAGKTGMVTGPHLHFEVFRDGALGREFFDPEAFLPGGGGPDAARSWSPTRGMLQGAATAGGFLLVGALVPVAWILAKMAAPRRKASARR